MIKSTFTWLCLIYLCLACHLASAQSEAYYTHRTNAANGYWRLFSNHANRTTTIRFFDSYDQLLYQETLAGKYVKLTKRTVRLFDSTLHRLAGNYLLASQIKSYALVSEYEQTTVRPAPKQQVDSPTAGKDSIFIPEPFLWITGRTKLNVSFINPAEEHTLIELTDQNGLCLYSEWTWLYRYRRPFNVANLPAGQYSLLVAGPHKIFTYRLIVGLAGVQYTLQASR